MSIQRNLMDAAVSNVETGAVAMTRDGKKLGTVADVEGRYVKINAPLARDYWLKDDYVAEEAPGCLTFGFDKKDVGAYRVDKPVLTADPVTAEDAVLTPREQDEQRERMERELQAQRRPGQRRNAG